jgi:hypothetical protein
MALQADSRRGVGLDEVWQAWDHSGIDPAELADRTGWTLGSIRTLSHYRGQSSRLHFPTWAEYQALLGELFEIVEAHLPGYELGERCPLAVCRIRFSRSRC